MRIPMVLLVAGCGGEAAEKDACGDMCQELVMECQYRAFPSLDSCEQGCAYDASVGADVAQQFLCVRGAGCDTFQILECEHEYGPR